MTTTVKFYFSQATDAGEGLLSVAPGVPAAHALSESVHLLDGLIEALAEAATGEPISEVRAYQLLTVADMVRALVASCADGMAE